MRGILFGFEMGIGWSLWRFFGRWICRIVGWGLLVLICFNIAHQASDPHAASRITTSAASVPPPVGSYEDTSR